MLRKSIILIFKAWAHLPLWWHYLVAKFGFFLFYYVFRYRRKVVIDNLQHAFPDKKREELEKLSKSYFQQLGNLMVEVIKMPAFSKADLRKRVKLVESEDMKALLAHENAIVYTAHFGNWEWAGQRVGLDCKAPLQVVYKSIKSQLFNDYMRMIRTHFGNIATPMEGVMRFMVKTPKLVSAFLADQTPTRGQAGYWGAFFGRIVPFFDGPEKIAAKKKMAVFYGETFLVEKGYYEVHVTKLADNAALLPKHTITRKYAECLEQSIKSQPHTWIWSHKRWKHAGKQPK